MERQRRYPYTLTGGPTLTTKRGGLTRKDMVTVLNALRKEFGEDYDFALEPISEGGITFTNWPGKRDSPYPAPYKSIRFHMDMQTPTRERWPWLEGDEEEKWKDDTTFLMRFEEGTTFLKAIQGAPAWTREECAKFRRAFKAVGIVFKGIPKKLNQRDDEL